MEQPYKGRSTILDNISDIQIIIPAKKNWFVIIFLGAWLCAWCGGEIGVLSFVIKGVVFRHQPGVLFILVWLVAWSVGGVFAFRFFLWSIKGKEIITVGQGTLMIDKRAALFFKPKTYDLNEVRSIRIQEDNSFYGSSGRRYGSYNALNAGGTIRFDYGLQTVKFAAGIDEAEAKYIIQQLKDRRLLTEKNWQ